jgi:hypothetical protein
MSPACLLPHSTPPSSAPPPCRHSQLVASFKLMGGVVAGKLKAGLGLGPKYAFILVVPNAEQLDKVGAGAAGSRHRGAVEVLHCMHPL